MLYGTTGIPVGAYDINRMSAIGLGHWAVDGGIGYTYYNEKAGVEWSVVTGLTYNFVNPYTDYRSGIDWHVDWSLSPYVSEKMLIGAVGYVYGQLTGDSAPGVLFGDSRSRVAAIGPQIGFFFPVRRPRSVSQLQGLLRVRRPSPAGRMEWLGHALDRRARKIGAPGEPPTDRSSYPPNAIATAVNARADGDHEQTHHPWLNSGEARKGITADKQHHDRDAVRQPQSQPHVVDKYERNDDRKCRQEAQQANAERAAPIVAVRRGRLAGAGASLSLCNIRSTCSDDIADVSGCGNAFSTARRAASGSLAASRAARARKVAAALPDLLHQIKSAVDDPPGEVASQRPDQHGAHVGLARHDAERRRVSENHDQAEQDFRDPVHRIKDTI